MATTALVRFRVALRVRPLSAAEQSANYRECITFAKDEPQILLGSDRAFTFDWVLKPDSTQRDVFTETVAPLVERFIEGNNVTILAYGSTGSGKTYSMGTGMDTPEGGDEGIVQRFACSLFDALEKSNAKGEDSFQVYVSFLELYHEDINDLLEPHRDAAEIHPSIREALDGSIYWAGVREERVFNAEELLGLLRQGAAYRATGSTDMNAASSRSHAVFSVLLKQQMADDNNNGDNNNNATISTLPMMKRLASKFHFVDLAGSERLKRTIGDRQKEGISINTGLLALGNVISALGDESRKGAHVPYRDSKLTRLLQDSLGGNSHTLMLACVSPADADFTKTLNTLKYAGRARNIQNRVEVNHDYEGSPDELNFLRTKVSQLKMQLSTLQKVQSHHPQQPAGELQEREELARIRQYSQEMSAELARVQSERDTLLAQISPDHVITEAHPVIRQYAETVESLKLQLAEAHSRLQVMLPDAPSSTSSSVISSSTITHGNSSYPVLHQSDSAAVPAFYDAAPSSSLDHRDEIKFHRPVVTLSGRRQKSKYVPLAQRMKTHTRQRGADATGQRIHMMADSTNGHSMPTLSNSVLTEDEESENANNMLFVWSQSQDETVIQDLSGLSSKPSDLFRPDERDHNGNPELEKTSTMYEDMLTNIESGPSSSASCEKVDDFDDSDGELEALAVPTWSSAPRTAQSTNGSTKRESLSWTDSLLDDSDNSVATSRLSSSWTSSNRHHAAAAAAGRRKSKDLLKMLHQVQADLLVKNELVGQLEKSEDEYTQMRSTYEGKLNELQEQIMETEKERDVALRKQPGSSQAPLTTRANARGTAATSANVMQLRETRQADEVRRLYEQKLKKLSTENQELKRKYTQTNHTLQTARAKAETYVGKLQSELESLKLEKKQMHKASKTEIDKSRELIAQYEREMLVLKRREAAVNDARKKLEEANESQAQLLRRRNDEVATMAAQMRQLTLSLRRAAGDGVFLNEATLERIMNTSNQRATKSPTRRRSTPTTPE
ncbi:P-loop containing nucleoside triphosphate hydrolase protein [Fennellomyces sp. T-0311]|nr:P-loop containing nucleoside triphosphate hydrolase protein [Fennellomyces sp. T-0311]